MSTFNVQRITLILTSLIWMTSYLYISTASTSTYYQYGLTNAQLWQILKVFHAGDDSNANKAIHVGIVYCHICLWSLWSVSVSVSYVYNLRLGTYNDIYNLSMQSPSMQSYTVLLAGLDGSLHIDVSAISIVMDKSQCYVYAIRNHMTLGRGNILMIDCNGQCILCTWLTGNLLNSNNVCPERLLIRHDQWQLGELKIRMYNH